VPPACGDRDGVDAAGEGDRLGRRTRRRRAVAELALVVPTPGVDRPIGTEREAVRPAGGDRDGVHAARQADRLGRERGRVRTVAELPGAVAAPRVDEAVGAERETECGAVVRRRAGREGDGPHAPGQAHRHRWRPVRRRAVAERAAGVDLDAV